MSTFLIKLPANPDYIEFHPLCEFCGNPTTSMVVFDDGITLACCASCYVGGA